MYIFRGRDATVGLVDQMVARLHRTSFKGNTNDTSKQRLSAQGERKVWGRRVCWSQEVLTEMCCEYCWHQWPSHVGISVLPFVTQLSPSSRNTLREKLKYIPLNHPVNNWKHKCSIYQGSDHSSEIENSFYYDIKIKSFNQHFTM